MILKIFSPKNSEKKMEFLTQNKAKLCKILIITLVFEKNANFFAENRQKSQKIVIITSTPDEFVKEIAQSVAQPVFVEIRLHRGKVARKGGLSLHFSKRPPKVNNLPNVAKVRRIWPPCSGFYLAIDGCFRASFELRGAQ
jgi:phosphoserine phosphatase